MRRLLVGFAALVLLGSLTAPAVGDPNPDPRSGFTSKNVQWLKFIPNEIGTLTGARIIGHYLYMTSWRGFSIYDVANATDPQLVSTTPWAALGDDPFEFESEDMPTNGKVLIMSETLPRNVLHVIDVTDRAHPVEIATEVTPQGAEYQWANHTMSCLWHCKWLYGSVGAIVDLRDPHHPKLIQHKWNEGLPGQSGHDLIQVKPGYVLTATEPMQYLDVRDPIHPKVLALGHASDNRFIHSVIWPKHGTDRFLMASGETNFQPACGEKNGDFQTWSTKDWEETHTFHMIDEVHLVTGTYTDGNPAVHGLGCSTHWFRANPTFHNGGIVAEGAYENGSRFWGITPDGHIKDYGYYTPYAGSTSADYWRTERIVYSIDYGRGFDVLKYTGPLTVP